MWARVGSSGSTDPQIDSIVTETSQAVVASFERVPSPPLPSEMPEAEAEDIYESARASPNLETMEETLITEQVS